MKRIFILDWDDTIFPTSWFLKNNTSNFELDKKLRTLDDQVIILLENLLSLGRVIIITNASYDWILESSKYLPKTKQKLDNKQIPVISARQIYQSKTDIMNWKILTFRDYFKNNPFNIIISIGDAEYEYRALVFLYKNTNILSNNIYYKSIKFIKHPSYNKISEQLTILNKIINNVSKINNHNDLYFRTN